MRALVTGGAGFIGSNLVDALLDRGDEVTVVDNLATGRLENLDGARRRGIAFHEADITDAGRLRKVFAGSRPDIVFHLAAQIDVRKSIEDPAWDASINVGGTINVLEAARHSGRRARRQHLDRRRDLRRGRADPDARERVAAPDGRLRDEQALRRDLLRLVRAPLRPLDRDAALRQRLRPAPGPARRGRASSRSSAGSCMRGDAPDDLRRRAPDARLHLRRRRRRGEPRRRVASRGARRLQRRHRPRVLGARGPRRAAPRGEPRRGRAAARVRAGAPRRAPAQRARRRAGAGRARVHRAGRPRRRACGARSSGRARRPLPEAVAGAAARGGHRGLLPGRLRAERGRRALRPLARAVGDRKGRPHRSARDRDRDELARRGRGRRVRRRRGVVGARAPRLRRAARRLRDRGRRGRDGGRAIRDRRGRGVRRRPRARRRRRVRPRVRQPRARARPVRPGCCCAR